MGWLLAVSRDKQKPETSDENLMRKMHRLHPKGRSRCTRFVSSFLLAWNVCIVAVDATLDGWPVLGMCPVVVIIRMFVKIG